MVYLRLGRAGRTLDRRVQQGAPARVALEALEPQHVGWRLAWLGWALAWLGWRLAWLGWGLAWLGSALG